MEALENTMVACAILWLVQTILDSLTGKLDNWVRQIGLADDVEKLRKEVMRVKTVVSGVKGRATGNDPLAQSLARIRELLYDADDTLDELGYDELDYFRLQHQVEGGAICCVNEPEGTDLDGAEQGDDESRDNPNKSSGGKKRKNRSKAWDHFEEKRDVNGKLYAAQCISCRALIKCGDTSGGNGLNKHIKKYGKCFRKPPSNDHQPTPTRACDDAPTDTTNAILDSVISKRMRIDEASALDVTTNTYPWNKDKFSKRIHQITFELQGCRCDVIDFFKDSVASSDQYQSNTLDTRLRTTSLVPRKVYGRDTDKDYIISRVVTAAESHIISVLPIVGIAGVGKTAVAQLVYNDPMVESQFERIWVCVSYIFDEVTLTREILDFLPQERIETSLKIPDRHEGAIGLGKLQEILNERMQYQRKRFLLILDDVWHNLDDHRWKRLLLPLQSGHAKGNVILVTTRDLSVAQRIGTEEPIQLGALKNDEFWLLFKSFAFGDDNYGHHTNLNSIGEEIAEKLKGNPLAAETAGKILRERLMDNLVSLVHLVASGTQYSESIGKVTSLQELNCSGSDITKLQFMSELVQLGLYKLGNVTTRDEAYGARLKDKRNLEKLQLSWKDNSWQRDLLYDSFPRNDSNSSTSSEDLSCTASDVLEGLEPHHNLKHLQVLGYCGAESPAWLGSPVSFLQTLHLQDCGEWGELRFLGSLPFLTKLKLINMQKVQEISIPSLQELALIKMPKLDKCSCDSVMDLNSSLRVLKIKGCHTLKVFPLFGSCEIEQKSWLFHLRELTIHYCPDLVVPHPLPPSDSIRILSIMGVSKLPEISGSSNDSLCLKGRQTPLYDEFSNYLREPSKNILAFHNLRVISSLEISNFDYPIFSLLEGFRQLINLKILTIYKCKNICLSNVSQEDSHEDMAPENINALPSLKELSVSYSSMEGMCLSMLLRNVQTLEELRLCACTQITGLFIEKDEESELSNLKSASEDSSSVDLGDALTGSSRDKLLNIPSKLISSLKKISFNCCFKETFQGDIEVFSKLTSLEKLCVEHCPGLVLSRVHKDKNDEGTNGRWLLPQSLVKLNISGPLQSEGTLRLCFPGHLTGLKTLIISGNPCLESLQLQYCTSLEELEIGVCRSLTALKGLTSLGGLRSLDATGWPHLIQSLERVSSKGYDMCPRLEILGVCDYSFLNTSFCEHLISLKRLRIEKNYYSKEDVTRLTDEQERALQLLTSLQELQFLHWTDLEDLPVGLHKLPSLKRLEIQNCKRLSRLPEKGLPPSLKELDILWCPDVLTDQCRMLATGKLKVIIDWEYVNL